MKFVPYSFSKINLFQQCPKKWEFNYVKKINLFESSLATERGSYVHTLLENATKKKPTKFKFTAMTPEDVTICDSIFERYIESEKGKEYFDPDKDVKAEVEFGVKIVDGKFEICGYSDQDALFRGKIDHQILHKDWIELLDWKTGKVTSFPAPLQLVMYAVWAFIKYPFIQTVRTAFVYVEHHEEKEYIFHREHFEKLLKKVIEKIVIIEKAKSFPKNETKLCDYCDFRKLGHCTPETHEDFNDRLNSMVKPYKKKINNEQLFEGESMELFYYIHPESGCAWIQDWIYEDGDGLVEEVEADVFYSLEDLGYDRSQIDYKVRKKVDDV